MPINANLVERDPECDLNSSPARRVARRSASRCRIRSASAARTAASCCAIPSEVDGAGAAPPQSTGSSMSSRRVLDHRHRRRLRRRDESRTTILDAVSRRTLGDRADHAVGHGGLALPRRRGDPRLQSARARRRPQAAQAHPAHGSRRPLRGGQRTRRGGHRRAPRHARSEAAAAAFNDRSGVYVGSGGGNYQNQYDFFPLMTEAHGELDAFGRELTQRGQPDVAPAHAAEQRAGSHRDPATCSRGRTPASPITAAAARWR